LPGTVHLSLDFSFVRIFFVVLALIFSIAIYRKTYPESSLAKRVILSLIRFGSICIILILIFNPQIVVLRKVEKKARVVILIDSSKSMSIEDCGGRSRWYCAVEVARRIESLIQKRDANVSIHRFSCGPEHEPVRQDSMGLPEGEGTDIWEAIISIESMYRGDNLRYIWLLSDGQVTSGYMKTTRRVTVPVFVVGFGDTVGGPDLSVEDVEYPRNSYMGTEGKIVAVIRAIGLEDSIAVVELSDGDEVVAKKKVKIMGKNSKMEIVFPFLPGEVGVHKLAVRVERLVPEKLGDNNTWSFRVNVFKSKHLILFIDEHLDWNTTFLEDICVSSGRFRVDVVTWLPSKGFVRVADRSEWSFPSTLEDIRKYDLICISDLPRGFLSKDRIELLERYLNEGGSLLFLADENSPILYTHDLDQFANILPVIPVRKPWIEVSEYYPVKSGTSYNPLGVIIIGGSISYDLPPLSCVIGGIEPSASSDIVLELQGSERKVPFLIIRNHGKGVTSLVNGFPLWRWKVHTAGGESFYDSFIGALLQYLIEEREKRVLELVTTRSSYRTGEKILVQAFVRGDLPGGPVEGQLLKVNNEQEILIDRFRFQPVNLERGQYEATLGPLPEGDYRIVALFSTAENLKFSDDESFSVEPESIEFRSTSMNRAFLDYVASSTGGSFVNADELKSLVSEMNFERKFIKNTDVIFILDSIYAFIVVMCLLSLEWLLRKVWGMV